MLLIALHRLLPVESTRSATTAIMTEEDRSADIEDIAEDAVNELLGMYGYEGVGKDELKASLKKRGLALAGNDFSLPNRSYHPYLHGLPVNRLLMAATSSGTGSKASANNAMKGNGPGKGAKGKTQSTLAAVLPHAVCDQSGFNGGRNLQLCQWCKKEKAQIIETMLSPAAPSSPSTASSKLKFCSGSCLNAYKLDIIRRETEACLRNSNGLSAFGQDDSEPIMLLTEKPIVQKTIAEKKHSVESAPLRGHVQKNRSRKDSTAAVSSVDEADLWSSAVGSGKRSAGRTPSANRVSPRFAHDRKPNTKESNGAKSEAISSKQQRSKRRSAPPRPHPYYALNKKYWMTIRGSNDSRDETSRDREDSSNGDSMDEVRFAPVSNSPRAMDSLNDDPKISVLESRDHDSADQRSQTYPSQQVQPEQNGGTSPIQTLPRPASKPDIKLGDGPTVTTASSTATCQPFSLASLFSTLPLNLMWIPVPIPIPLPIPIPIPLPSITHQQKLDSAKMSDDCPQD